MANTYLTRTPSSSSSGRRTFTWSGWIKRNNVTAGYQNLFSAYGGANYYTRILYWDTQELTVSSKQGSNFPVDLRCTTKHRDTNAWYHIVVAMDSTQSTVTDRIKIYFNGVRQTGFHGGDSSYPSLNEQCQINHNDPHYIGHLGSGSSGYFDGIMSHVHFADGTAYPASTFGSTDSTTGEWKINTSPSFTPGTNGFSILKDGNGVTDVSANSNNWTIGVGSGGGLSKTEDSPSNVFCTWNPNYRGARKDLTLENGNTYFGYQNSGDSSVSGTIAVSGSGKYYWEQRIAQINGTNAAVAGAMHTTEDWNETPTEVHSNNNTFGVRSNGNAWLNGTNLGSVTAATYNNDVLGIGFDVDNARVFLWRNGVAQNSGNAIITGIDTSKNWIPFGICHGGARVSTSTNWGNGYFQNNPISSAGTNASGNGIFEYDVPSGYTAISTKGLNL